MLSASLQSMGWRPAQTNAWGMLAGTLLLTGYALVAGLSWRFDTSWTYVGSWLYLAIPGSVIAFTAYLTLVGRLGPEKAAYATVLFPIVALSISALFEGYVLDAAGRGRAAAGDVRKPAGVPPAAMVAGCCAQGLKARRLTGAKRASASSSLTRASTQRAPSGVCSFFQKGASDLR